MTVIATARYQDGSVIVAADSRTSKGSVHFPAPKLRRTRTGIVAAAGDDEAVQTFLDWATHGADVKHRPHMKRAWAGEFEGLMVTRAGIFDYSTALMPDEVKRFYHAIGSGAEAAMAVFAFGEAQGWVCDPRAVVKAVCEVNKDCGPPVDFLTLRSRRR